MLGLVDLRDLAWGTRWQQKLPQLLEALGWTPQGAPHRSLLPPERLAVVLDRNWLFRTQEWGAWLKQSRTEVVILDERQPQEASEFDQQTLEADFPQARVVIWKEGDSLAEVARLLTSFGTSQRPLGPQSLRSLPVETQTGGWWEMPQKRFYSTPYQLRVSLGDYQGRTALASPTQSQWLDLQSGRPLGPLEKDPTLGQDRNYPLEVCAERGLAASGGRCRFQWRYQGPFGNSLLAANAHDWPLGHAKKLYGHRDNEPVALDLSLDAVLYASSYDVDVVLSDALPFAWQPCGHGVVALLWPPLRLDQRVFFHPLYHWTEEPDSEDFRDGAPALALGPSGAFRYALALDREVWSLDSEGHRRVDRGQFEWAVYDRNHQVVEYRGGRLLGGDAYRLAVYQDERVTLCDWKGRPLGPPLESGPVTGAVTRKGTILLYRDIEEGRVEVRVV